MIDPKGVMIRGKSLEELINTGDSLDLSDTNLATVNLAGVDLRKVSLKGANLTGADLRGTKILLSQLTPNTRDLSGLAEHLWEHAGSWRFRQLSWCGTACCFAGAAAEYMGEPDRPEVGIIAIRDGLPGFNLDVLYQTSPYIAIEELKRFIETKELRRAGEMREPKDITIAGKSLKELLETRRALDLSNTHLAKANLVEAKLRGTDMREADLRGADLRGADLSGADLSGANLNGANLIGARLTDTDLTRANLVGAKILLSQLTSNTRDLSDLATHLWEHAHSDLFDQRSWCGTLHCLSGEAGAYMGEPTRPEVGVIAIRDAMPGFNLEVLYQGNPDIAIEELKRFVVDEEPQESEAAKEAADLRSKLKARTDLLSDAIDMVEHIENAYRMTVVYGESSFIMENHGSSLHSSEIAEMIRRLIEANLG